MFPLAVGNWWVYRVEDGPSSLAECKINVVTDVDLTADGPVYEIEKLDSKPNTSWLLDTGSQLGWLRKLWRNPDTGQPTRDDLYAPFMLRLDYGRERLCTKGYPAGHEKKTLDVETCGRTWDDGPGNCEPEIIVVKEAWTVLKGDVVDAGVEQGERPLTYCVARDEVGSAGNVSEGTFCFQRGVGKVFEGTLQEELLLDHCVDGDACPEPPNVDDFAECSPPPDAGVASE